MSGAEALLVVGIIANIVQLVEVTSKVVNRVKDSAQDGHNIPKAFRIIQVTLPLLANTLRNTDDQVKSGKLDEQTCNALRPVVEACEAQMIELKAIFVQALPAEGAFRWRRGWKAISSVAKDKKVDAIASTLSKLRLELILHHVTDLATRDAQNDIPEGSGGPITANTNIAGQFKDARQRELEERCLHSLAFPSIESRRLGIEEPKGETCSWFFEHPLYQQWDLRGEAAMSHGLLWIKGKPGSGKSTLMKRLVETSEERPCEGGICISFFFSARGTGLERSIISVTHLSIPNEKEIRYGRGNWTWHVKELKEFFHASIAKAGYGPFKIFVDALDECKDDDVQEAVTAFERSAATSMANGTVLDICWSSRHYPHIRVQRPLEICMEHENAEDIATYVRNEVKDSSLIDRELESEIIRKAHGGFLWVVLVFRQLLDAEDLGQSRAEKKRILEDLPSELDDLFRGILKSVKLRHRQTRTLLFQYAMVASEPLSVRDMQVALAFSANPPPDSMESWRLSDSYLEPHIAFPNFVREVSGGLLEISKGGYFQFIHESVRDFMQSGASHEILGMHDDKEILRQGHQNLRNACLAYLSSQEVLGEFDRLYKFEKIRYLDKAALPTRSEAEAAMYSFVSYAAWQWPTHARAAEDTGQSQADLVQLTVTASFHAAVRLWAALEGLNSRYWHYCGKYYHETPTDGMSTREALLWVSCATGVVSCIHPLLQAGVNPSFEIGGRKLAWIAAAESGLPDVVRELLNHDVANATDYPFTDDCDLRERLWSSGLGIVKVLLEHGFSADSRISDGQTLMQMYVRTSVGIWDELRDTTAIIRMLAAHGADIRVLDNDGGTLLHMAVKNYSRPEIISCLIDAGADVEALNSHDSTVLHHAVGRDSHSDNISCLIDVGANIKILNNDDGTLLHMTVENRYSRLKIISCLIEAGADIEARNCHGSTVLHHAVERDSHPDNISCLINSGADVKTSDNDGFTVLHLAVENRCSRLKIISSLIDAGADVETLNSYGNTVLHHAVEMNSHSKNISCLIDAGADVEALSSHGSTVLHHAVGRHSNRGIISRLINAGADVEALNRHGSTVLHHAVERDSFPGIISHLIDAGADVKASDRHGRTVLHHAVCKNIRLENISRLIDAGVDTKALDSDGFTVLQMAYRCESRPETIARLIDAGADINCLDTHGRTALHSAILQLGNRHRRSDKTLMSRVNVVQKMLNAGVDPNGQDEDGNTPLHLALGIVIVDAVPGLEYLIQIPEEEIRTALGRVIRHLILYGANLTTNNSVGVTAADLITSLPESISEQFKVTVAEAAQELQEANHVFDTESSGFVHPGAKGKKESSESQGAMGER